MIKKVDISPGVAILSMLKYIEYEVWFALAEFVDNAIDSFIKNRKKLEELEGKKYRLIVKIEIDEIEKKITIRDNASGIDEENYSRAFRAAEIPPDTGGLSEFGMGMKTAACWFSDFWSVTTTALNESYERKVTFDMSKIYDDKIEELEVKSTKCNDELHYTVIELFNVSKIPKKKTLGKVKEHLKSIYREFIRSKSIMLFVNNEQLEYEEPKILFTKFHEKPNRPVGEPILWKREINFPIDDKTSVRGFVALREIGSTSEAGFALFRRGRVIKGSFDNGFKPEFIFGNPNSFRYQRVFGELHLEGFNVSFTKKDIQWDDNLDIFLNLLRDDISTKSFPLLQQAENYRARSTDNEYEKAANKVLDKTTSDLQQRIPSAIDKTVNSPIKKTEEQRELTKTQKTIHREFEISVNKTQWNISIELSYDPSLKELIEVGDQFIKDPKATTSHRQIGIRLSLIHPFMVEFIGTEKTKIEPILRMAAALGLSEVLAKQSGVKTQGEVRRNFNELILNLSKQE